MSESLGVLPSHRDPDAVVAWRGGVPVTARQFLRDAAAQATRMAPHGPVVNLCSDRYHFAVVLAAAVSRGHTSLLPPNALPETLARLRDRHGQLQVVTDGAAPMGASGKIEADLAVLQVDGMAAATVPAAADVQPLAPSGALEAVCLLTSGTTGVPQPHAKRWSQLVRNVASASQRLAQVMERDSLQGLTLVATVPAQHSYGLESSVLLPLLGGAALDSSRPFYPADIAAALERVPRPRALVTTPFHLKTLLAAGLPLPPVDLVLSATAPLSVQLALHAEQVFGGTLLEIYGCTEAGQVATRRTSRGDMWQTFGELRVHAEGSGDDERFIVQGGHVVEPTPLADMLQIQDPGHFRLFGRTGDLIHVAGKRSSLSHLNHHLNSIEGVLDGAFWLADQVNDGVVRPVAFVVAPTLDARQIIAALRLRLEPAFVPRKVVHVQALPREATGKLPSQNLRRLALEQLRIEDRRHD